MRVEFSPYVEEDLDEIAAYIVVGNPRRAVTFIQDIRAEIERIADGPQHYQLRPEIGEDARMAVVGRYVILFRIAAEFIRIERIVQGNRLLPPLLP